jgi:hypothetical protein
LRSLYLTNGGARFPLAITQHFTLVNDWSTGPLPKWDYAAAV